MHPTRTTRPSLLTLISLVLVAVSANAQDRSLPPEAEALREEMERPGAAPGEDRPLELISEFLWLSGVEGDGLDVDTARAALGLRWRTALDRDLSLGLGVEWEHSFYDIEGLTAGIPGARDAGDLHLEDVSLSANLLWRTSPNLGWFLRLVTSFKGEIGAEFGESLTVGGLLGADWRPDEAWRLRIGVGAFSRLEEDALVIPAISADWRPNDDWRLEIGFPETRLSRRIDDAWTVSLGARFEFRDWRLDEPGPLSGAVLRDDSVRVELGATWRPSEASELRAVLGVPVWREITVDADGGARLLEADLDVGFALGLEFRLRF